VIVAAEKKRVSVEHGAVLVRGEAVPDHVQRLVDGQSIDVHSLREVGLAPNGAEEPAAPSPPLQHAPNHAATQTPSTSAAALNQSWRALASRGDYAGAYREVGPSKIDEEATRASVDDLLALGDVARLSGHPREAIAPLTRVIDEHTSDARAGVAAFTLGRIQLDTLARPDLAAAAFARSIELGLPEGLAEDAYVRLVEADAKAGDRPGAHAAADAYARRFPQGSRAPMIARWLSAD
jgi:transmembrane sensor